MDQLSKFLKSAREAADLSQWDISEKLGYTSAQFISNWERDVAPFPVEKAKAFAKITGCSLSDLRAAVVQRYQNRINKHFVSPLKKSIKNQKGQSDVAVVSFVGFCGLLVLAVIALGMWGCPQYNVYSQKMDGEAQLAHAHASRQVQIQDAQSKLEAAKSLADAEIERARGVAEANKIIGNSLKNNDAYLRYLYIDGLKEKDNVTTIYVPTEGGIPILESGRGVR